MNNHTYFELIAFFHRSIYDCIRQGSNIEQAKGRSFDDFWSHSSDPDILNNIIVLIESINIEFCLTGKFRKQPVEMYRELEIQVADRDLSEHLTAYEIEVFKESIEVLNGYLKTNPIQSK